MWGQAHCMTAYRLVSLNHYRTGNSRSDSGKKIFLSIPTKMNTLHVQASPCETNLAVNSIGYCTMKINFLYDLFLKLLICLCDISYCFQVHQRHSLPMLLLNSFFRRSKSNSHKKTLKMNYCAKEEHLFEKSFQYMWINNRVREPWLPSSCKELHYDKWFSLMIENKKNSWKIKTSLCFCCESPVSSLVTQQWEYLDSFFISSYSVILSDFLLMTYSL